MFSGKNTYTIFMLVRSCLCICNIDNVVIFVIIIIVIPITSPVEVCIIIKKIYKTLRSQRKQNTDRMRCNSHTQGLYTYLCIYTWSHHVYVYILMYTWSHQNSLTTQNRIPLSNLTLRSSKCLNKDDPKKPKQIRGSLIFYPWR